MMIPVETYACRVNINGELKPGRVQGYQWSGEHDDDILFIVLVKDEGKFFVVATDEIYDVEAKQ